MKYRKNKKVTITIIMLMFFMLLSFGCSKDEAVTNKEVVKAERLSTPIDSSCQEKFQPLFVCNTLLGGFNKEEFYSIDDFLFDGKKVKDMNVDAAKSITLPENALFKKDNPLKCYHLGEVKDNTDREKELVVFHLPYKALPEVAYNKFSVSEEVIGDFTNPYPRKVDYNNNLITVDLDNDGKEDRLRIEEEVFFLSFKVGTLYATINGKEEALVTSLDK